jgi:FixJ family two-component response regulator
LADAGIPVKAFGSATELLDSNDMHAPAILLVDVQMPGMSGIELHALLREGGNKLPVMFLTGASDIPMAVDAMRNGAVDFVEKPFNSHDLVTRVRRALALCTQPALRAARTPNSETARRLALLTTREREVYDRVILGKTSKVIASELGGSFRTIEIHRGRVMSKMAATHVADLVRMAIYHDGS